MSQALAPEVEALLEVDPDALVAQHGPFWLTKTGVMPTGEPTFEEWEACLGWCQRVEQCSPFWVGDLIAYAEARWGEKYAQALDATKSAYGTLANQVYVSKAVTPERRVPGLSFAHHQAVAPLPPEEQTAWLQKAETDNLTRDELRHSIKVNQAAVAGHAIDLWLLVRCADQVDLEKLAERMRAEGRAIKLQAHTVKES